MGSAQAYRLVGKLRGEGVSFELNAGPNLVGRDASSQVALDLPEISRFHAIIAVDPGGVIVADLESLNGTFVDRMRIQEKRVGQGSLLAFGPLKLRLEEADPVLPLEPAPSSGLSSPSPHAHSLGPDLLARRGRRSVHTQTTAFDAMAPREGSRAGSG